MVYVIRNKDLTFPGRVLTTVCQSDFSNPDDLRESLQRRGRGWEEKGEEDRGRNGQATTANSSESDCSEKTFKPLNVFSEQSDFLSYKEVKTCHFFTVGRNYKNDGHHRAPYQRGGEEASDRGVVVFLHRTYKHTHLCS